MFIFADVGMIWTETLAETLSKFIPKTVIELVKGPANTQLSGVQ